MQESINLESAAPIIHDRPFLKIIQKFRSWNGAKPLKIEDFRIRGSRQGDISSS